MICAPRELLKNTAACLLIGLSTPAVVSHAQSTDLTTWTNQGGASKWDVPISKDAVFQSVNGDPTVFFDSSVTSTQGISLSGRIRVTTTNDDDFIGFVLAYDSGEISSPTANFLIFDWKQNDQANTATHIGKAGIALSHVTNASHWWPDFWSHTGGVREIARGANLGFTGWEDMTEYTFNIIFTASQLTIMVNGQTEISVTPEQAGLSAFPDGAFGFYNMSQSHVLYSAIKQVDCTETPYSPECNTPQVCDLSVHVDAVVEQGGGGNTPSCSDLATPGTVRPTSLTFQYIGGGCSASSNQQGNEDICSGDVNDAASVNVVAHSTIFPHDHNPNQLYTTDPTDPISLGESFTITRNLFCETDFSSQTYVEIADSNNALLSEKNRIHTSCEDSQPLHIGDIFGSLKLVKINGMDGSGNNANDIVTYTYTVTNNGDALQNINVSDSEVGQVCSIPSMSAGLITPSIETCSRSAASVAQITASVAADLLGTQDCTSATSGQDSDVDGILDGEDNCPYTPNTNQADTDGNGVGDACEPPIYDTDQDGVPDEVDNCIFKANPSQADSDADGIGDECDKQGEKKTGCNATTGNIDLMALLLLIFALYYGRGVWQSRRSNG